MPTDKWERTTISWQRLPMSTVRPSSRGLNHPYLSLPNLFRPTLCRAIWMRISYRGWVSRDRLWKVVASAAAFSPSLRTRPSHQTSSKKSTRLSQSQSKRSWQAILMDQVTMRKRIRANLREARSSRSTQIQTLWLIQTLTSRSHLSLTALHRLLRIPPTSRALV